MFDSIDSQEKIVLAKMAKLMTKYSHRIIKENGDGKNLLECSGLSVFIDKYEEYLTPHSFNGHWKNEHPKFKPGFAINEICAEIQGNKKALGMFFNEFISRIEKIDDDDIEKMQNYLEVLGYKLEFDDDWRGHYNYSLSPYTEGALEREKDVSYLVNMLQKYNSELITYYTEAISTYGNSEYQGCISNCRTLFEKIFKYEDNDGNYQKGILKITKEEVSSNPPRLSINGIFNYWLNNQKGFNRYRLFITLYSLMSALGPHGEEIPSKSDALMCLRITEDILIWYFQTKEN